MVSTAGIDLLRGRPTPAVGTTEAKLLLDHALLLEQGVLLCEPSTRIDGMAGAGIGASQQWVAVPLAELRGELPPGLLAEAA